MENRNKDILELLSDYLTGVKLNAVLPPDLMKLEPRNGVLEDSELEVKVFDPKLEGTTHRAFELQIHPKGHTAAELKNLEGRRIKLTPSGASASYEAPINRRGFVQFKNIPPAYYFLELRS